MPFLKTKFSLLQILLLLLGVTILFSFLVVTKHQIEVQTQSQAAVEKINSQTPIFKENSQSGTTNWKSPELKNHPDYYKGEGDNEAVSKALKNAEGVAPTAADNTWTKPVISGYAEKTSINQGSSLRLFVSTTQPTYSVEIYRMGFYQSTGGKLIQTSNNLAGRNQSVPYPNSQTGLLQLNWSASLTVQTDSTWASGVYLAKLIAKDGSVGYINFVVRNDSSNAAILYVLPVTTYQSYNNWGGKSLYDYNSTNTVRASKVSYDRPYAMWAGSGGFFDGDYNMIRFLEQRGYDVTYATSLDMQENPNLMANHKVYLSNYHDEYWSKQMRDNLTAARDAGKNLAFFDANNIFWQIRFENSNRGVADRIQVAYKDQLSDPQYSKNPSLTTVQWRQDPVNNPENSLLGQMYESDFTWGDSFPYIVTQASNWIFDNTNLKNGDQIAGLVGYEYDKVVDNGQTPGNIQIISTSPVIDKNNVNSTSNSTIYWAPSGAMIFDAGTIYWPWKLDDNDYEMHGADARVQQMTVNILDAMTGKKIVPPPSPSPSLSPSPSISPSPSPSPIPSDVVFNDSLTPGWVSWSWGSNPNFNDTTKPFAGTGDILWTENQAYGGLYLHNDAGVDTTPFNSLTLAIESATGTPQISLQLYDTANNGIGQPISLANYGGDPVVGSYKVYTIPLQSLGGTNKKINGFHIQDVSGGQISLYIDSVALSMVAASPSPSPTPSVSPSPSPSIIASPTPSPSASPAPTLSFYQDAIAPNFVSWSWDSNVNFSNFNNVYSGTNSISYIGLKPWSAMALHTDTPIDITPYKSIHFAAKASQAGQKYVVLVFGTNDSQSGQFLDLTNYGGNPNSTNWTIYDLPLSDLKLTTQQIKGIAIQDNLGQAQPALFIDELQLR